MSDVTPRFVFGVDLDGVCADFYGGLRPVAAEWLGVPLESLTDQVTYGLPEWHLDSVGKYDELHRFAVTQRELFRHLRPIHGAAPSLRRLSTLDIRIRIITNRLYIKFAHRLTVAQTIEWLEHHGIPYWDLCFMNSKSAVGADLYIDDTPHHIESLRGEGHPTIVFTNSTNRHLAGPRANSWSEVESMVLEERQRWLGRQKA
jgi:5'(3')-deoxyribonucleotidase